MGMRKWRSQWLKRVIPLTLATGVFLAVPYMVPADMQKDIPAVMTMSQAAAAPVEWNLADNMGGWKYGGIYSYAKEPKLSADTMFDGSIRVGLDFTANASDGWSEVKVEYGKCPLNISGYNVLSCNLYFKPENMTQGSFKAKLYGKSVEDQEVINLCPDLDLSRAKDAGNGYKCLPVKIAFKAVDTSLSYFCLSIVGCNTDYKGDMYIGQLALSGEKVADGYVDVKAKAKKQPQLALNQLQLPAQVALVDTQASPSTAGLFAYLQGVADSNKVLYGHQNELHKKVGVKLPGSSDTEDMVADQAAVMGLDALALTGDELVLTEAEKARGLTLSEKLAGIYIPAAKQGAILTMSCHMPNFELVQKRGKVNGQYDFTGYSPNNLEGDIVARILPGGDLNQVYTAYLDMVADFDARLQKANVPLIFRPFHENNGSWFWWGASSCTPSQYKNLFRYTVEYMRDIKGLHNLLYAYSPGGPLVDEADYLSRYPGDAFVDVVGFDMYHRNPATEDAWMDGFAETMDVVADFAKNHHKVAAVTECGMLYGNSALVVKGNTRLDWFNEALVKAAPAKMAYFMTWSNFDESNFDQPYMVSAQRGQELVNGFIDFYNQPASLFMKESADYKTISTQIAPAVASYGYILAPGSYTRVLDGLQLSAQLGGKPAEASFRLVGRDGSVLLEVPAAVANQQAEAKVDSQQIKALGEQIANVELVVANQVADSVPVLLNMPAPAVDALLVDDFDSYYGDNGLLAGNYNTNTGSGCTVSAQLSQNKNAGEAGLAFNYSINKGGYAGIIKSLKNVSWAGCKAVQMWVKPDGMGQKLIIQLNSNGEDFEVDLSKLTTGTEAQVVTLPFSQFKGKNGGTFDPAHVKHFAIYCNTIGEKTINSTMFFDSVRAVK